MEFVQEIELWYVIPAIRRLLVLELKKQNVKQKEIAVLLGITEPAVSQYIRDKRAQFCCDVFENEYISKMIKKASDIIKNNAKTNPTVAMKEINKICAKIRENKTICEVHKRKNKTLHDCEMCYEKETKEDIKLEEKTKLNNKQEIGKKN